MVTVVKHDEGFNARSCNYTRVCWLMFLAFPLDFQKDLFIRAAVAPYGRLLEWYRDENKSRILVQVLLLSPNRVPRSLIVSRGTMLGGVGRSWAVPVYILNGNFPDAFPAEEDPVPFDGEAHPEHPPVVLGPNVQEPNWKNEHNGAAPDIDVFGGNPHPQPHPVQENEANVNAQGANFPNQPAAVNEQELDDIHDDQDATCRHLSFSLHFTTASVFP